ncbi:Increased recombination centers protein 22 [Lithohypha guttulata]|uniref:Increased recombination centers protein 22 n=1 Tax=Lithohypha guttulata TaxID=1690604 RepID=UPI002DE183F0|nr:Increased recombination centers protein 22 [Lithohypha guttulata]KAK5098304.1 Increased recombination centers protein 22 [Lithohypha guttulata]
MRRFLDIVLLFLSLGTSFVAPADVAEELGDPSQTPTLNVQVKANFPDAEIFGIKIVNGKPANIQLSFTNQEPEPVAVQFVGGSLWTPDLNAGTSRILRNLTTKQYGVEIPAGESETLPYTFQTNMHPQELRLNLAAVIARGNTFFTQQAFNGTVQVVEPNSSIFDPQIIFLYLFLLACTAGVGYFFYNIWIAPYFPQKKKGKAARNQVKKIDVGSEKPDTDGPAVATGMKAYAEEWIPSHHLQRPEARRVKSGGPRPKSRQG